MGGWMRIWRIWGCEKCQRERMSFSKLESVWSQVEISRQQKRKTNLFGNSIPAHRGLLGRTWRRPKCDRRPFDHASSSHRWARHRLHVFAFFVRVWVWDWVWDWVWGCVWGLRNLKVWRESDSGKFWVIWKVKIGNFRNSKVLGDRFLTFLIVWNSMVFCVVSKVVQGEGKDDEEK